MGADRSVEAVRSDHDRNEHNRGSCLERIKEANQAPPGRIEVILGSDIRCAD